MKTGRIFSISIAIALILTSVIIIDSEIDIVQKAEGAVLHVPASYSTIQGAINSASSGDTIILANGTYYESFIINRSITIIGNGSAIIEDSSIKIIQILADNVSIYGINITTTGNPNRAIEVLGVNDTLIQGCHISGVYYGIYIVNTRNCVVNDTTIYGSDTGFSVYYAEKTTISNCSVDPDPLEMDFITSGIQEVGSGNSTFIDNVITTPGGIITRTSYDTEIINNTIHYFDPANYTEAWSIGISADPNTLCTIYGNSIKYHGFGLYLSSDMVVIGNVIDNISIGNSLSGDSNILLHNRFSSHLNWGIEIYGDNNTLRNNTFSNIGWHGIKIKDSERGSMIESCSFENIGDIDILLETSKNVTLTNNSMESGMEIDGTLIEYWNTHDVDALNSVSGKPLRYFSDQENISLSVPAGQVIFSNCSKMNITNYRFSDIKFPLSIVFSDNISVDASEFVNASTGIFLKETHNVSITTNVFYNSDYGIWWNSSFEDMVQRNLFKMNNRSIYVEGSSYLQVTDNSFESHLNDIKTLFLDLSRIEGNDHRNSTKITGDNIQMSGSIGNVLTMNNGPSIRIFGGSLNMIYHNIDLKESYDYEPGNIWNLDYPHGGNHWASYSGKDFLKGPHQDIIGGDWIGDDPVYLNPYRTAKDEYPLMSPYGSITEGGSIFISNPDDGDVVSGNVLIEANVVSSHFYWVNFYVNGELVLTDSEFPYQMVFHSNNYAEGSVVNITAQLEFITIPNSTSTVFVTVDNVVEETDSLIVETNSAEYHPDQQLTVNVSFQGSYVQFDEMVFTAVLDGPDPIMIHYTRFEFETSDSFMFLLDIPSDIPIGDYILKIEGSAYWGDINLWRSSNSTHFRITGKDIHSELDDVDSLLEMMDNFEGSILNDTVNSIYQGLMDLQQDVDFINGSFSQSLSDIQSRLSLLETQMISRIETLETNLTRMINNMNTSIQQMVVSSILGIMSRLDDVDSSLTQIINGVNDLDIDLIVTRASIMDSISDHDDAMFENTTDIMDMMQLRFDQMGVIMQIMNSSIHQHLDGIDSTLDSFRTSTLDQLTTMQEFLIGLKATTSEDIEDILDSINETRILLVDLDTQSMETIGASLHSILERIDDLEDDQAAELEENITKILVEFINMNTEIEEHNTEILAALSALSKLDEIIEDVESVESGVKESEDDLSTNDDSLQTLLFVIILFLIVILALQGFMLNHMRNKGKEKEEEPPQEGLRIRKRPERPAHTQKKAQKIGAPGEQPRKRPKSQSVEVIEDWEEFEELEEL